jgi:hypothetical protein
MLDLGRISLLMMLAGKILAGKILGGNFGRKFWREILPGNFGWKNFVGKNFVGKNFGGKNFGGKSQTR